MRRPVALLAGVQLALAAAGVAAALAHAPVQRPANAGAVAPRCHGTLLLALPGACTHGADAAARASGPAYVDASPVRLRCTDGRASGNRIQVLYAHFGSAPDRLRSLRWRIISTVLRTNGVFVVSARVQGGYRALRFVQSRCGVPSIADVHLSSSARNDFDRTIFELAQAGYNRVDRKYLLFADSTAMCGIASVYTDDRPTPDNINNAGPSYARVDNSPGCWNGVVAAHEVTHMLGGVQTSAPHATSLNHCTDGHDVMCYDDGSPQSRHLTLRRCGTWHEDVLDCGRDDYFNLHPSRQSYLASHWDIANSSFLYGARAHGLHLPGVPGSLTGTTGNLHVVLGWKQARGTVSQYVIRRNGIIVATVAPGMTWWNDSQPRVSVNDIYTVTAQNAAGLGRPAYAAVFVPPVPGVPSDVKASTGWKHVTLTWASESGVDHWIVLRDSQPLATLPARTTQFVDDSSAMYGHSYAIVAANVSGQSAASDSVSTGPVEWLSSSA